MLRSIIPAIRIIRPFAATSVNTARIINNGGKTYSTVQPCNKSITSIISNGSLLCNKQILGISHTIPVPVRTVTKFSLKRGKRKTVKAVLRRFYRLDWGAWIRPKVGRQKKMWKKSSNQKRRLKQHVFCNATQATLLDKMVSKFWLKPKYFVENPYEPYHTREEFPFTRKKPFVRTSK